MNDAKREYQRDVLDDIDEAVAQITDEHVENRHWETLRRAALASGQCAGSDGATAEAGPSWLLPCA